MRNKFQLLIAILFAITASVGQVWGNDFNYTFTDTQSAGNKTWNNVAWTLSISGGTTSTYSSTQGAHYGTNNSTCNSITITSSAISGTINSISIEASRGSSLVGTLSVKVNNTAYTLSSGNAALTTSNATNTFTGSQSGNIEILWTKSSGKGAFYIKSITVSYTPGGGSSTTVKTLKSIAVSGMTTEYERGDAFSFDGTCTATYSVTVDDEPQDDEDKAVTPTSVTTPDMTTTGEKEVTVSFTDGGVTKTVDYTITVSDALPKITITQDQVESFTNTYAEYTWTASDVSGKMYAYKNSGMQFNSGKAGYYVYNTDAIPGNIRKIKMKTTSSGSARNWTPYVSTAAMTATDSEKALTAKEVGSAGTSWDVTGSNSYFYLTVSGGSTVIESIVISYEEVAVAVAKPTIPGDAIVVNSVTVTINCDTEGATIYYTTDAAKKDNPTTTTWIAYDSSNKPTFGETTTIYAAATDGTNWSNVAEKSFTIYSIAHAGTSADPYTVADAHNAILVGGDLADKHVTGKISQIDSYSDQYHSITYWISDDGTTTNQLEVYSGKGISGADFSSQTDLMVGDDVVVKGTLKDYQGTHEFDKNNELVSRTPSAQPVVYLKQSGAVVSSLNLDATDVVQQGIDLEYENFASAISDVTAKIYSESTCDNEITSDAWVTGITVNGAKDQVTFNVADNDGEARECWMKVTASDGTNSAFATLNIKQAKFSVDYATLPFEYDGNGTGDLPNGLTVSGTGTYTSSPAIKFDGTGDYILIKINADPGTLTYDIKNNGFSGGTFTVQESANGEDYSNVAVYTSITNTQSESKTLAQTTRYVKFIYTNKSSGNVALGNITISAYSTPSACEIPAFDPADGASFTESLDVILTSATAGATIYYTLDGEDPTTSSSVFDTKITLTETTTIKAMAVKEGLENSGIATATYTKAVIVNSYDIDFEADATAYVNWDFSNATIGTNGDNANISARNGTHYGTTGGKATAAITTKEKIAKPGTFTCYVSKQSGNTTSSTWYIQVSSDGESWIDAGTQSATSMSAGTWVEFSADLTDYTNVYVRLYYGGGTAVRNVDDISLEMASAVKKPTISGTTPFVLSTSVTLECETTGATIYYTTDGTDPKSGNVYSEPFNVTETTTVKAIAKLAEEWSNAVEQTFSQVEIWTVAKANTELATSSPLNGKYVRGIVSQIDSYGNNTITYWISDNGYTASQLEVYKGKNLDNSNFDAITNLKVGDIVVVYGNLQIFNDTKEFNQGNYLVSKESPEVATPVFNPDGGGFVVSTDVTITCATTGSTVYYTTDGTNPTNESTQYTAAIPLTADATIKAVAYVGEKQSLIVTRNFTLSAPMTVADAYDALTGDDIENVAVEGIVYKVDRCTAGGNAQYWISDDGTAAEKVLEIYNGNGLNNAPFVENGIRVGDKVIVFGNLTIYNEKKEFSAGSRLLSLERKTVTAVTVSGTPSKTSYQVGEAFDPAGLTVTLTYSDASNINVPVTDCSWEKNPATFNTAGTSKSVTVKATYEEVQSNAYTVENLTVSALHTVTYNTSGSTGTTPVDEKTYVAGDEVTLKPATGLTNPGHFFNGWAATYVDGNSEKQTLDIEDGKFTMPDYNVTVTATWARKSSDKWIKVTATDQLEADKEYIIVNTDATYAIGTQLKNNRSAAEVEETGGIVRGSTAVTAFTLGIPESGKYTFQNGGNYLYASSSSKNYLNEQAENDANGVWTISIDEDGVATIAATGSNTRNHIRFNPNNGSPLFSCYVSSSDLTKVVIYKKAPKVEINNTENVNVSDAAGSDIVIHTGGTLTVNAASSIGDLYVEEGGKVALDANKLTVVGRFVIETTMAGGQSGQLTGATATNIDANEAYIDITFGAGATSAQWHAFTVPFPVDALNGIYDLDGNKLKNELNYAIMDYHGDIRAQGKYGWKKYRGILVPGTFYLMTVDGERTTYRFKKTNGSSVVSANAKQLTPYAKSGDGQDADANWNGVGNPTLTYGKVGYNVYVLDPAIYDYVVKPANEHNFVVGTPFFIQASASGTMAMDNIDGSKPYYAPARVANKTDKVTIALSNEDYTDYLYISASEDARNEYELGKDLVTMRMSATPRVPRIAAKAYNTELAMIYTPLNNDMATCDLSLYAPANGEYTLSVAESDDEVLLAYDGQPIWNLTADPFVLDLERGTNKHYSLYILPNNAPTDIETIGNGQLTNDVRKVLFNGQLFIIRDGRIYDATGKATK